MGVNPGGQKEQPITQEQARLATDLLGQIYKEKKIPETFDPLNVDEIGMPGHKPVVEMVLRKFGSYGTFTTEYSGTNLPEEDKVKLAARYKRAWEWQRQPTVGAKGLLEHYPLAMKRLNVTPKNYSNRLHCLVLAHTPTWNEQNTAPIWTEDGQAVYCFMSDILGPKLGYRFDSNQANIPGDYNLIVKWAFENVDKIKQLYFDQGNPDHIDTQLARGNAVQLDKIAFETLDILLDKDVKFDSSTETTPIGKVPLSNAELAVAPPISTAWDFEKWFVGLDQRMGREAFRQLLPSETVNAFSNEAAEAYFKHLNLLSLLNLAILKDIPAKSEPIKRFDAKLGFGGKMQEILRDYLILVQTAQDEPSVLKTFREGVQEEDQLVAIGGALESETIVQEMLNSIHPEWGNHTLASALKLILGEMSKSEYVGAGSGRALLVQYNELARTHGISEHRMVHYMGMMVKLAKYEGRFVLDKYLKQIYE